MFQHFLDLLPSQVLLILEALQHPEHLPERTDLAGSNIYM